MGHIVPYFVILWTLYAVTNAADCSGQCPKGTEAVCEGTELRCQKCPKGYFRSSPSRPDESCHIIKTCLARHMITTFEGNSTHDAECGCEAGYELSSYVHKCIKSELDVPESPAANITSDAGFKIKATKIGVSVAVIVVVIVIVIVVVYWVMKWRKKKRYGPVPRAEEKETPLVIINTALGLDSKTEEKEKAVNVMPEDVGKRIHQAFKKNSVYLKQNIEYGSVSMYLHQYEIFNKETIEEIESMDTEAKKVEKLILSLEKRKDVDYFNFGIALIDTDQIHHLRKIGISEDDINLITDY